MNERVDDLSEVLAQSWALLQQGLADPDSPLRTPVLATVTGEGLPNARTVVLRAVDAGRRLLFVNTDARSPKFAEIGCCAHGVLVFYDPGASVQLRIAADLSVHRGDAVTREAWDALSPIARSRYATEAPPGRPATGPDAGAGAPVRGMSGYENFVVLEACARHLDWLHVADAGHRRAAFTWTPQGALQASWLYP